MNGLALYSGIAGIELGLKIAVPGYRTVCYVEREAYPAAITVSRMGEKVLDEAVVWDDAETFDGTAWRGKVDIISAGFPCQPVSVAGKRKGHKDKRWQWPTVIRIVNEVRPSFVFLENPPGIFPWVSRITAGLTASGYVGTYGVLSAAGCGAPHLRKRWFALAYTESKRAKSIQQSGCRDKSEQSGETLGNPIGSRQLQSEGIIKNVRGRIGYSNQKTPDAQSVRCSRSGQTWPGRNGFEDCGWWSVEPGLGRLVHGIPSRMDRIKALGNAVVPIVAAKAWRILLARLFEAGMIDV